MWSNPQKTVDMVTFTEEILNWKLNFLCNKSSWKHLQTKQETLILKKLFHGGYLPVNSDKARFYSETVFEAIF